MTTLECIRAALAGGELDARGMLGMAAALLLVSVALIALWSLQGVS